MKKVFFLCLLIIFWGVYINAQESAPPEEPPREETSEAVISDEIRPEGEADSREFDEEEYLMVPYSPFVLHKPNYIVFGSFHDQVKAQVSFKYEFFKQSGFFLAYSQQVFWDLYEISSPLTEVTLSPELFWNYGNNVDYFRLGFYEHKSNGKDGPTSRAWDRSYIQVQTSFGRPANAGINVKGFYMWGIAKENPDIDEYLGYYEAKIFFRFLKAGPAQLTDKEELYISGGTGKGNYGFDFYKGWLEAGFKFRLILQSIQPDIFIQLNYGYGEKLVDYNKKDFTVRAGFILK